ncbi:hypothetical protein AY606_06035 [Acinetobacter sp. SFB]|nr:hypothetical protein AY606_06035 [Acinetobacter sp. SFB]
MFIGNPIEKMLGINFDKRGWISTFVDENGNALAQGVINAPNLYGENEGGVAGTVHVQYGRDNQAVLPFYKDYMESMGLQASAYPYQSYLAFTGLGKVNTGNGWIDGAFGALAGHMNEAFYLGNTGYMKEMLLWPKRTRIRNDGRRQWYEVRGDGAIVCEIDATLIPSEYMGKIAQIEANPPQNKWYGTSNQDNQYYEFTQNGLISGYVQDFYSQFGGYGKEGRVKTTFPNLDGLVMEVEIWGDDGISFFDWKGGGFTMVREWSQQSYVTCRKYWIIFDPLYPDKSLSFGITDQIPGGSNSNHKCVIWARLVLDPWSGTGSSNDVRAVDINPIHKIREILTDDTAMNKPESSVNDVNFIKAADWIWNEGLGVSWSITEKSCIDAINELCYHIEAGIRVNRQTGLYEMVLFRDNWFAEDEIHTITESKIKSMQYEITNADEVINQANVNYYDRANIKNSSFSISENGLIQTLGRVNAETLDFPYFMNMRNAEVVANWKLKQLSTGAFKGSFTTGWREARKWNRYDLIRLPWSKRWTGTILVRIMSINLGGPTNNEVTIEFIEVVPATGMMNTSIVADDQINTQPEAPKPCNAKVFELPYFEAVQAFGEREVNAEISDTPEAGYLCAIAEKPQNNSLSAALYVDNGNGFERVTTINYCETAYLDQAIDRISRTFTVKNIGNIASVRTGSQIFINDEIMVYQSYDAETKALTVKRGALDSALQNHALNSILYLADDFVAIDQTLYTQSEIINAKVLTTTPSGVLALSDAATHGVEFNARAIRPYPPANVKINNAYWPEEIETDLVLTWVDRNRLQQTGGEIIGWYEGNVSIEPNTQTHLILSQLDENDNELATSNANVTGATSYTMPISAMQASTRTVRVTLKTIRDGYECLNPFNHTIELSQFFSAPYNLTVEFKND